MRFFELTEAKGPQATLHVNVVGMKLDSLRRKLVEWERYGISYSEEKRVMASDVTIRGPAKMVEHIRDLLERHQFTVHDFMVLNESFEVDDEPCPFSERLMWAAQRWIEGACEREVERTLIEEAGKIDWVSMMEQKSFAYDPARMRLYRGTGLDRAHYEALQRGEHAIIAPVDKLLVSWTDDSNVAFEFMDDALKARLGDAAAVLDVTGSKLDIIFDLSVVYDYLPAKMSAEREILALARPLVVTPDEVAAMFEVEDDEEA